MRKKSFGNAYDQPKTWRQSAHQRGNQRESSPSYVLLYSDGDYSGDEESVALTNSNATRDKNLPRKVEVIEIRLKSEDTLQAIALRYGCRISEIKRINKIHKENEIYARRTVKVPVPPFSILTETLPKRDDLAPSPEPSSSNREDEIISLIATPIVNPLPVVSSIDNIILKSAVETATYPQEPEFTGDETERDLLLSNAESGTVENIGAKDNYNFKCSGADWGISWLQLLGVSLLLGFAGPLIYFFWVFQKDNSNNFTFRTTRHPS